MESNKKMLFKKISNVMSAVSRVPKNGYNSFHKYHYATESDLTEHIRPILFENGLAFFSNVTDQIREGEFTKVKMEFTIADIETGETLVSTYWGEGQDKGDKGLYKAYTGAVKYFLMKTFLIPTGDDVEADTSVDERNSKDQSTYKPKPISGKQVGLIKTQVKKIALAKQVTDDEVLQKLNVDKLESLTSQQASKAIETLNKWVEQIA